jgi:outer membrane receptor for ferric coprogen and ferric-rhodotorulic acid
MPAWFMTSTKTGRLRQLYLYPAAGQRDINSVFLDPTTGKSYEAGVKGDWFDTRLTATLSLFRIEQDNVAVNTGTTIPGRRPDGI